MYVHRTCSVAFVSFLDGSILDIGNGLSSIGVDCMNRIVSYHQLFSLPNEV